MSDFTISTFLKNTIPGFILDEHPDFVLFIKAYYEFLETKMPGQMNDLTTQLGNLKNLPDVDKSISEFEDYFFDQFAPHFPRDTSVSKEDFIKNLFDFYKSKGSENSFRLLFRMLFADEVSLEYPKNNVLVASGSRWRQDLVLRADIDTEIIYSCDGTQKKFSLIQEGTESDISVFLDGVLQTSGFIIRKEAKELIFDIPPTAGTILSVGYELFDISLLASCRITGLFSGTVAVIEQAAIKRVGASRYYEILIDKSAIEGSFSRGERVNIDFFPENSTDHIQVRFLTLSDIESIEIVSGGSGYSVGDTVTIRGTSATPSLAVVGSVTTGLIEDLRVVDGGNGYKVNDVINADGFLPIVFEGRAQTVNDSGTQTANTININTDIIADFANVPINSLDYGFPTANSNVNSIIGESITQNTITGFGPITSTIVDISSLQSTQSPTYSVTPQSIIGTLSVRDFGIIPRVRIISPGSDYVVGDQVIFTNTTEFSGQGASGVVAAVDTSNGIAKIELTNGGLGYQNQNLPNVTVVSSSGSGAILQCDPIMGTGGTFVADTTDTEVGKILSINLLDPGSGFVTTPFIDLSLVGNGDALANVSMRDSFIELSGRWETSQGILSNPGIKLQGIDYYIDFSYVIKTKTQFNKYKDVLKNILHPTGFISYSKFLIDDEIDFSIDTEIIDQSYIYRTWCYNIETEDYQEGICNVPMYNYYWVDLGLEDTDNVDVVATEFDETLMVLTREPTISISNPSFWSPLMSEDSIHIFTDEDDNELIFLVD